MAEKMFDKDGNPKPFPDHPEHVGRLSSAMEHPDRDYEDRESELRSKMVYNLAEAHKYWRECYENAQDDLEFIYSHQWDAKTLKERERAGRPALTMDYLPNHISIVLGHARRNRYGIKVMRKNGLNQKIMSERGQVYHNSEVMAGIIRDIEWRSKAHTKYIAALGHAIESGYGWLEICKVRPQDDPFNIELRIERIKDRHAVMWDPYAEQPDRSDAQWCAISTIMPRREFRERYGDPLDQQGAINSALENQGGGAGSGYPGFNTWWNNNRLDDARIVRYYWKEPMKRTAIRLARRDGEEMDIIDLWKDDIEEVLDELEDDYGYQVVKEMEVDSHKVMVVHQTSFSTLEGPMEWGGMDIPVVGVYGREIEINGKTHYTGIIRYAQDACRMANYWATAATERVGLSPNSRVRMTPEQLAGHEKDYDGSLGPHAVEKYNHIDGQQPPEDKPPADVPVAELNLFSVARDTIKDVIGIHDANLGKPSNEVSGRAITARKDAGLVSTQDYPDHLAEAIQRVAEILTGLIPVVYDKPRIQRLILNDDTETEVILNQRVTDKETGKSVLVGGLSMTRYTVAVRAGPAYATQREEMLATLSEFGKTNPQAIQPVLHLLVQTMDLPMADELSRIFKGLVPRHLLSEKDREEMPEPQPSPAQQLEMEKLKTDQVQAQSQQAVAQSKVEEQKVQLRIAEVKLAIAEAQAGGKAADLSGKALDAKRTRVEAAEEGAVAGRAEQIAIDSMRGANAAA